MDLGLHGRKALVTGASKGIGRACAEVLAEEGCDVVLVSRTAADLEAARAAIIAKHNVAVRFYPLDLSDSRNVDKLAAECAETDLLVNNAGAIPGGDIAQVDEARWRTAWDLKVFGYVNMTRRFYALMAARKKGVIVNILGAAGENPDFDYIAGSSGNASLMAFTRAMGGTAPRDGLRVIGINPGPVMTDRLVTLMRTRAQTQFGDAERWTEYMQPLAFGRAAKPEEIAWMAAFLASDLSAYTTGSIITIDGGGSSRRSALYRRDRARRAANKPKAAASRARLDGSGAGVSAANSPSASPLTPSVKKRVLGLPFWPPVPKLRAHRPPWAPPSSIGIVPIGAPVIGSKALISLASKLKFPTSRSPPNSPKPPGARAMPQGEASLLPLMICLIKVPFASNSATAPFPSGTWIWFGRPPAGA